MTVRITWWGHATTTVEVGGIRILTDPVLTNRVAHLRRVGPAPGPAAARAQVVLISHLHADHLHLPSLERIPAEAALVVPAGGAELAGRSWRGRIHQVEVGDRLPLAPGVSVRAVPAKHDGRRLVVSRHRGPALGYVIEAAGTRVWFAGDTGWFPELADLAPVDVALVPVGGWGPTLGAHHLGPDEAVHAVAAVGARHAIPIHYGTFWPTGLRRLAPGVYDHRCRRPGERFADAMTRADTSVDAQVLGAGETVEVAVAGE